VASHLITSEFGGFARETYFGVQSRYDAVNLGLTNTRARQFLSNIRNDHVDEASAAVFAEHTVKQQVRPNQLRLWVAPNDRLALQPVLPGSWSSYCASRRCQNGVMDRVFHPVEPLAVRLTLAGAF
jgi:hypothetical protein